MIEAEIIRDKLKRIADILEKLVEQNNEALEIKKRQQLRSFQEVENRLWMLVQDQEEEEND